jgi:DNA-binding CsgD family transcriptional regulator
MEDLSRHAGGVKTHIVGFDAETGLGLELANGGYDPEYIDAFHRHYAPINVWAPGFMALPVGVATDADEMCRFDDLRHSTFYHEWVRPQGDIVRGGGAVLIREPSRVFAVGGNIRRRDDDALQKPWLRLLDLLMPQMQLAFDLSRALAGSKLETAVVAAEGLRHVPAILILSDQGKVIFANPVGQTMLSEGTPVAVNRNGGLVLQGRMGPVPFGMVRWDASGGPGVSGTVRLGGGPGRANFVLRLARYNTRAGIPLPMDPILGLSDSCILAVISAETVVPDLGRILAQRFGLTVAEAEVAVAVHDGQTLDAIADRRGVSIHTVRHQVKAAMAKLGVRRQTDLVREIQRLHLAPTRGR